MRIISRYVFREIVASALLGTLLATFVIFLQRVDKYFELLVRSSAKLETVGWLFALALPPVLPLTVPFGVLVGILIGLGRMSTDGEVTAMRAAGVSSRAVIPPVLTFAFLAMLLTPPEKRSIGLGEKAEGPRITVAREAIAIPDVPHNRIQLSLRDASSHEVDKDGVADDSSYPRGEQVLEAAPPAQVRARAFSEMNTGELRHYSRTGPDWVEARIELHRRMAYPLACIMLALVGIPLGVSSRKGGKSAGYVTALFLAFFCYQLVFISLIGLAKQHTIPVEAAVWTPNTLFMLAGLLLIARLEQPGDRDLVGTLRGWFSAGFHRLRPRLAAPDFAEGERRRGPWLPLVPQLLDTYVLNSFLFYFAVLLASFVMMTEVYNFFELMGDIVRNHIAMTRVFLYLFFLIPKLIYDTLPVSVLVAVLVTFGVLTKHNEVTAFKACGVSLHRLAAPVLTVALFFSAGLFAFDHYYVPEANRRQDALRNEIKGRPVQTYLNPQRKWILGSKGSRVWYYKYFDNQQNVMGGVNVYELNPTQDLDFPKWMGT